MTEAPAGTPASEGEATSATTLLESQHRRIERLFDALEDVRDDAAEEQRRFDELARTVLAHEAVERDILLPAWEREVGPTAGLGETSAAHGLIDFSVHLCARAVGRADFHFQLRALREVLRRHIADEEEQLFPHATPSLEALGEALRSDFEARLAEPWRPRLEDGLDTLVRGRSKPVERISDGRRDRARHA